MSSIFTKIIAGEIPARREYEDEHIIIIHDIAPKAKTHLLVIPKKEIESTEFLQEQDSFLIAHMFFSIQKIAKKLGIEKGYQLHINSGKDAGQEVMHLHIHLLSDI